MQIDENSERYREIYRNLDLHNTEYLLNIWKTNDHNAWTDEALDVVRQILIQRLGKIPERKEIATKKSPEFRKMEWKFSLTHIRGEMEFHAIEKENVKHILSLFYNNIKKQNIPHVSVYKNEVAFKLNLFRFYSNWSVFSTVDQGKIILHPGVPGKVKFSFSLSRLFIMSTFAFGFIFILLLPSLFSTDPEIILFPILAWLITSFINYAISAIRLSNYVKRIISKSN